MYSIICLFIDLYILCTLSICALFLRQNILNTCQQNSKITSALFFLVSQIFGKIYVIDKPVKLLENLTYAISDAEEEDKEVIPPNI